MGRKITKAQYDFLAELRWKFDGIKDDVTREVYRCICYQFQEYLCGNRETKQVTKEEILTHLCNLGLMKRRADGSLPDDRRVRDAASSLLCRGLPIVATAHKKGYFVAETPEEINVTRREYRSRINRMLEVEKGCEIACGFVMGQGRIFG